MQKHRPTYWYWIILAALLGMASTRPAAAGLWGDNSNRTGFLVLAADRGFAGDEEISDAFIAFAQGRNASLVFVTDERTQKYLARGLAALVDKGAERIVVIPLFISAATPRYQLARKLLALERPPVPVAYARPYGDSYFAVEDLADKLRAIRQPADVNVLVVGHGADDDDSAQAMQADWQRIAEQAAAGFGFASVRTLVAQEGGGEEAEPRAVRLKQALADAHEARGQAKTVVVPFHLGPRHDSMMAFDASLNRMLPADARLLAGGSPDADSLTTWLQREANLNGPLAPEDIGVVFLSHGADFNWNDGMREAVQPLMKRYRIEFAFSMADQPTIARALHKLEQRGAKAAVIVRVFALEESFRGEIERMVGLDVEGAQDAGQPAYAGHGHGHTHGAEAAPPPRIRTALPVQTAGGLGANPLFAAALLDRARSLSKEPAHETVILLGHGSGNDHLDERWQQILESMADQMRQAGGDPFRAIRAATWREDWPDKRAAAVENIRALVEEAGAQNGKAIVIPARTTGQGPEKKFLSGLDYELGSGFAPHPLFEQWVDEKIRAGAAQFNRH